MRLPFEWAKISDALKSHQKEQSWERIWIKQYGLSITVLIVAGLYIYYGFLNVFFFHDDFMHLKMVKDFTLTDYLYCGLFGPCTEIPWFWNIGVGWVFRPISHYVAWSLYWHVFETNYVGYHFGNMLIHIFNTLLVFWVTFSLTSKRVSAYIAGLLYTSAFTIIIEVIAILHTINDSLMIFFALLSFGLYIQWQRTFTQKFWRWTYVLSVASYACALLCNEKVIVMPAILLGYDLLFDHSLPREFGQKLKSLVKREGIFWLLAISLVLFRLKGILGGLTESWFSIQIGWWALPKYFWGVKWFLSEYIEPLRMVKNTLFPSLHLNLIFGVLLLFCIAIISVLIVIKMRFKKLNSFSYRLLCFGLCWFLLFPLPILFNKPFGAYYFVGAIPGLCFIGGYFGEFLLDKLFSWTVVRVIALALFTVLTVFGASTLAKDDLLNPHGLPRQANLSHQVLEVFSHSDKELSKYNATYLVGFPVTLFNMGEPGTFSPDIIDYKAATAFEVFAGYPADVNQIRSLEDISITLPCQHALVLTYEDMERIQDLYIPLNCHLNQTDSSSTELHK